MLSRWVRTWLPGVIRPLVAWLARAGVTANRLTVAGVLMMALAGLALAFGLFIPAALGILLSGILDSLDGELARLDRAPTLMGTFIDSVADHYGDFAVYLGLTWWALQHGEQAVVLLTLVSMFGTLAGSHIRARAEVAGVSTKTIGIFTRAERNLVWILGLLTHWILPALVILAAAGNISALQRLWYALAKGNNPG